MNKKSFWKGFVTGSIAFVILIVVAYLNFFIQPDITLDQIKAQDLKGKEVSLTKYIGKPLVVNFWATWCSPCINEFPHFEDIKKELGNDVQFVMISDEAPNKIISFKDSKNYSFTFLKSNAKLSEYSIYSVPTTYFYNANGTLVKKHTGGLDTESLKEYIHGIQ
ncbi:MAG: TlpA family protein disulfide reductase [Flavobacteriales bacterium]|nr:TlpA family protein disulfide reductase [Flavobacteriales bacterium]